MRRYLETMSRWLARVTDWVVAAMAMVMISCLALQVFSRYVLGATFIWTEELALFLFTWLLLLATASAIRRNAHVRLQLLTDLMPEPVRDIWVRIMSLVVLAFCLPLAWSGWVYVGATLGQLSAAVRYPVEALHLAAPVSGALGAIHALNRFVQGNASSDGAAT